MIDEFTPALLIFDIQAETRNVDDLQQKPMLAVVKGLELDFAFGTCQVRSNQVLTLSLAKAADGSKDFPGCKISIDHESDVFGQEGLTRHLTVDSL